MTVDDVRLDPKTTDARLQQVISQIVQIINEGSYEQKTYSNAPTASSSGFEGETRNVVTGATFRQYKYAGGFWWYTDATVTNGWTKLT